MQVHFHTKAPSYCVETTPWGWALAQECTAEKVEPCSERVVADVWFAPSLGGLWERLHELGVSQGDLAELHAQISQAAPAHPSPGS